MSPGEVPQAILAPRQSAGVMQRSSPWPTVALRPPPCKKIPGLTPALQLNGIAPDGPGTAISRRSLTPAAYRPFGGRAVAPGASTYNAIIPVRPIHDASPPCVMARLCLVTRDFP
jgi:hypothetical protein